MWSSNQWYLISQVFVFQGLMKQVRMSWDVKLYVEVGEPLVVCQCKKPVSIMFKSGVCVLTGLRYGQYD